MRSTTGRALKWRAAGAAHEERSVGGGHTARRDEVLDIHDGEIMPTIENRRTLTKLIGNGKNPFREDIAVGIDDVIEPALDALLVMESQIHDGNAGLYLEDAEGRQWRREEVRRDLAKRYAG
jgi:hypothetical protein